MQNFYWSGMYIVISRYCKPCSICQKGTQKGRTPKANSGNWCSIFQFSEKKNFNFTNERKLKQVHSGMYGPSNTISRGISNKKKSSKVSFLKKSCQIRELLSSLMNEFCKILANCQQLLIILKQTGW